MYDVIIVGGAPAGLTAGIYAARRLLKTLIITKKIGGQAIETGSIENYPGYIRISGAALMEKFQKQAIKAGAEIVVGTVTEVKKEDKEFVVKADGTEYKSKTVILAFGRSPMNLGVPGEEKFTGKGVSYCVVCDIPLYKNKTIAIVGGGNAALEGVVDASSIAKKIYLIHRRDEFRGFEYLIEKVKDEKNVEILLSHIVTEIKGDNFVRSIAVKDLKTDEIKELNVDGVFIEIGSQVKTDFVEDLVRLDEKGHIVINSNCETYYPDRDEIVPGLFAAGDVTNTSFKQIVISAGEGSKAALQAYNYIHGIKEGSYAADWEYGGRNNGTGKNC